MSAQAGWGLVGLVILLGCRSEPPPLKLPPYVGAVEIGALDSLLTTQEEPVRVSISGRIAEPGGSPEWILEDATGQVLVRLPVEADLPVGLRFQARGPVRRDGDALVIEAVEWLYDSTAVPVRSP